MLGKYSGIMNGNDNIVDGDHSAVLYGDGNSCTGNFSVIWSGKGNLIEASHASLICGEDDTVSAAFGSIISGIGNRAGDELLDTGAIVIGGEGNRSLGKSTVIIGGEHNTARGAFSTIINSIGCESNGIPDECDISIGAEDGYVAGSFAGLIAGLYDTARASFALAAGYHSVVPPGFDNSVALNGQAVTASGQTIVNILAKASGTFTIDHPLDPENKILNHYFVESPEMVLVYRGITSIGSDGRVLVLLPDYFNALNKNPMIQLTGVRTPDVYVEEEVKGNSFIIGGKPGAKVFWTVTGERKDQSAEITKILMPVEQPKDGGLAGRSLNDNFLCSTRMQLERMGKADKFQFRTSNGRQSFENMKGRIAKNR